MPKKKEHEIKNNTFISERIKLRGKKGAIVTYTTHKRRLLKEEDK